MRKFVKTPLFKNLIHIAVLVLGIGYIFGLGVKGVSAGAESCTDPRYPVCWNTRVINQWACERCSREGWRCAGDPNNEFNCNDDDALCAPYGGPCLWLCLDTSYIGRCEGPLAVQVNCNTSPGNCNWTGELQDCQWQGNSCSEPNITDTLSCCGPGSGGPPTTTPSPSPSSSCTISLPNLSLTAGDPPQEVFATTTATGGTIIRVNFASSNTSVATVTSPDTTLPFSTFVTALSPGTSTFTAVATMNTGATCNNSVTPATISVGNPVGWWQVEDSDVTVVNGDIISPIPGGCNLPVCDPVFGLDGTGGYAGVPMYTGVYDFSSGPGTGTVSNTGWLSDARYVSLTQYNYAFFLRLVPGNAVRSTIATATITPNYLKNQGAVSPDGFKWYFRDGDLTMQGEPTLAGDKVILFVNGNLTIDGIIDLTRGSGFFMAIVAGNIIVDPDVVHPSAGEPELEGLFVADGNFISGSDGNDEKLYIRGMVTAYQQVQLDKQLDDNSTTPAELFIYAPDLLFNYPRSLTLKRTRWKEVTP